VATIQILGQGFKGATALSFSGTSATFSVQSDTYLTTKVPAGATTGIAVATFVSYPYKVQSYP
jgi:hypothetical protein